MTFNHYFDQIGANNRKTILDRLNTLAAESSIMHQMVQNLFSESRLDLADWDALASKLLNAAPGNKETEEAIRAFCLYNRSLKGGTAKIDSDTIFGKIISLDRFCEILVKLRYHMNIDEAKTNVTEIMMGCPPSKMPKEWKEREVACFIMWSTFNPKSGRPFGNTPLKAELLLCVLGIPPEKGPHLIFEYRLPDGTKPYIPTICNAYAGDFWTRYFRPAPPGASYGLTMPTDNCPIQQGRPEVVHEVIKAKHFVAPLERAL